MSSSMHLHPYGASIVVGGHVHSTNGRTPD